MKIVPVEARGGRALITAYGALGFRFGATRVEGSVLLPAADPLVWPVRDLGEVDATALAPVLAVAGDIEFLLLGTGPRMAAPPAAAREALRAVGIGVEFMDTAAACRLHNTLVSEGRAFAAGFIAIP